jgi:RHS repeat-associated protein
MTDSTGAAQARYEYGMWGEPTQNVGTLSADFQYAGYYAHGPSGLNLCTFRAYSSSLGRFINRDPIEEYGGLNLYGYVGNTPSINTDPSGLAKGDLPSLTLCVVLCGGKATPEFLKCTNHGQCGQAVLYWCLLRHGVPAAWCVVKCYVYGELPEPGPPPPGPQPPTPSPPPPPPPPAPPPS